MFDHFQKQSSQFFKKHTELDAHQARMLNWGLGLAGEAGEVTEILKHHIFGEEPLNKMELAKELGDVLWYISALCTSADIDLSAVAELNAHKLAHRYGYGYSVQDSAARHEKELAFVDTMKYKALEAKINHTPSPLNVIFVGPDGSGKTTISKRVAEALASEGFTYHKCDWLQENKPQLCDSLLSQKCNVIYDRFYYPDDIIYSRVQHEKKSEELMDWDTDYWRAYNSVLNELSELNTLYIFVTASEETLIARSASWADDYIDVTDLHKICVLYDRWLHAMSNRPILRVHLDTTERNVDECVSLCIENIRRAQAVFSNLKSDTYFENKEAEEHE